MAKDRKRKGNQNQRRRPFDKQNPFGAAKYLPKHLGQGSQSDQGDKQNRDGKRRFRGDNVQGQPKSQGFQQNQGQKKKRGEGRRFYEDKKGRSRQPISDDKYNEDSGEKARPISAAEIRKHDGRSGDGSFWGVIDGWVVDATAFVKLHPGGMMKILSIDEASVGATGKPFGFSFSRGPNSHLQQTGRRFHIGVKKYLKGTTSENKNDGYLPQMKVDLPYQGKIVIIGRLKKKE